MASEWIMYLSIVSIGVLTIAGVSLTFNAINVNTIENTVEIGLNEIVNTIAEELKYVLELGLQSDPLTRVNINRSLELPTDLSGYEYEVDFKILPGAKHWYIEAKVLSDADISEIEYETTIPWQDVTLTSTDGFGLPIISSLHDQHFVSFIRNQGTEAFRIIVW
ncbi:MAG: hypothetical protein FK733_07275 [Asgard group archaeon]|nr:hypothetical protein [Asgard group archaeon]